MARFQTLIDSAGAFQSLIDLLRKSQPSGVFPALYDNTRKKPKKVKKR